MPRGREAANGAAAAGSGSDQMLIRPRLYLGKGVSLGPGKIDLLRKIKETGSISAAARALGLPYKRAWLLLDSLSPGFSTPLLETFAGGKSGGGARLTPRGEALVAAYDELERKLNDAAQDELQAIRALLVGTRRTETESGPALTE